MKDTSTHDALLTWFNNTRFRFNGLQLEFLRGFTNLPDSKMDDTFNEDIKRSNNKISNRCIVDYEDIDIVNKSTPKRQKQSNINDIIELQ
jgi:hypothetical protein